MKRISIVSIIFLLCTVLCACMQTENNGSATPGVPADSHQSAPADPEPPLPDEDHAVSDDPLVCETLSMELVVEWSETDALLSRLNEMSILLCTALEESGCIAEQVVITINTAGGFTADALSTGTINAAVLPAVDFLGCSRAAGIAMSSEDLCETVIAISLADDLSDDRLSAALYDALLNTAAGQEFLSLCRPGAAFTTPTDEAMQAVADWVAAQNSEENGGDA